MGNLTRLATGRTRVLANNVKSEKKKNIPVFLKTLTVEAIDQSSIRQKHATLADNETILELSIVDNLNGSCNSVKTLAFLVPTISQIDKEEIRFDPLFPLSLCLAKYSHFPANSNKISDPRLPTFI